MKNHLCAFATLFLIAACLVAGCSKQQVPHRVQEVETPITGSAGDGAVDIKPQWKMGQRYAFHLDIVHHSQSPNRGGHYSENASDKFVDTETTFGQDYALSVTNELRNGIKALELEILSLQLDVAVGDQYVLNYDSESRIAPMVENPVGDAFERLINETLGVDISSKNRLLKIIGGRELIDKALGPKPNNHADAMLHRIFSSQNVRQMLEFNGLPDKPVSIGDSWPFKQEMSGGSSVMEVDCTFKGWQQRDGHKCALLEFGATIPENTETTIKDKKRSQYSFENRTVHGRMWFDPQLSIVRESQVDQSYTMITTRTKSGNSPPEKYPTLISSSVSLKLTDTAPLDKLEAKN